MLTAPDWGHWVQMGEVELWQAAALSAGIEPRKTEHFRLNGRGQNEYINQRTRDDPERTRCELYQSRIDIALNCLGGDLVALSGTRYDALVSQPAFARWAVSKGWLLPVAMAALIETPFAMASQPSETPPGQVHVLKRRTELLDAEIQKAKELAIDSSDANSVWVELCKLAERGIGALIGFSSDGVQYRGPIYQATQEPDVFTFKNLRDRMRV